MRRRRTEERNKNHKKKGKERKELGNFKKEK